MEDLTKFNISNNPIQTFNTWLDHAKEVDDNPEAFALATSTKNAIPSVRYLLHKGIDESGNFRFFTNYNSEKAKDLDSNPIASMAFFWRNSARQVRIEGKVERMSAEESKKYFHSRDRDSQIASAISQQSDVIESREVLLETHKSYSENLGDAEVPYPENWGGYLLSPTKIEFFIYGEYRLNDRFLFSKSDENCWNIQRLQP
jgi:pyridoxamine 5'-phosphate oxidase